MTRAVRVQSAAMMKAPSAQPATPPIVRFAPSPTGRLHVGNIRPAVLNWLFARRHGGTFLLRLDDTDAQRSREEYAEAIRADLSWLGLGWAREERQSDRSARYAEAAARLSAAGWLYPCYETEAELDRRRKRQLARGAPPIYDRAGLKLTPDDLARLAAEGRKPHWRFRLANTTPATGLEPQPTLVSWNDLVRGDQMVDIGSLSDPVLIREDGTCLYTFTSVVDDIEFGITHVVRGEDHVTNTGVQIALFEAMGAVPPAFAHHSLLIGADGHALSKRLDSLSIGHLREAGLEPLAVITHAALIGTSDAIEPKADLDALAAGFDFAKISMAPARFDEAELANLNARLLHTRPFGEVAERLAALGVGGGAEFWAAIRGNVGVLADAAGWWRIATEPITPLIEDAAYTTAAAGLLPPEPWDTTTWSQWTGAIKAATGAKGRALFHPLRLALTGREDGPELKTFLPFIGRARAHARLSGETA